MRLSPGIQRTLLPGAHLDFREVLSYTKTFKVTDQPLLVRNLEKYSEVFFSITVHDDDNCCSTVRQDLFLFVITCFSPQVFFFFLCRCRSVMMVTLGPPLVSTLALVRGATAMVTPAAVTQRLAGVW